MPEDILLSILEAVKEGQWWLAVAGVLSLLALALRRHGAALWAPLASPVGVVASTFLLSGLGGVANALAAGAPVDWSLLITAVQIGASASGLWGLLELGLQRAAGGLVLFVDGQARALRVKPGPVTGRELRRLLEVPDGRRIGRAGSSSPIGADDIVDLHQSAFFHTWPGR